MSHPYAPCKKHTRHFLGARTRMLVPCQVREDASGRFRPVVGCGPRTKKGDFECPLVRPLRWVGVTVVSYCLNEAIDGHQYLVAVSSDDMEGTQGQLTAFHNNDERYLLSPGPVELLFERTGGIVNCGPSQTDLGSQGTTLVQ